MKKTAIFGLLAMMLAFGFIGMGCPTEDKDSWGKPPKELVGTWDSDAYPGALVLIIEANGDLTIAGAKSTLATDGSKYRISGKMPNGDKVEMFGKWEVSNAGAMLELSEGDAMAANYDGTYTLQP